MNERMRNRADNSWVTNDLMTPAAVRFPVNTPIDPQALLVDTARIAAVRDTQLLDTAPEEVFDRLTALTARLLNVPITFLSLIDSDRDFHKSRQMFGKAQQSDLVVRGRTFCHYTLVSPSPVVITDATQVPLYRDISTVRDYGVRAFAGIPLTTREGQRIGTFCAIDVQPKEWSLSDLEILSELAQAALREISIRQALRWSEENALAARTAVRKREEVLATVAQDLQTPLKDIRDGAQSLSKIPRNFEEGETVQRVQVAADKMQNLVGDLLEVSKIRQSRVVTKRQLMAPHELLDDAVKMMRPIAQRHAIEMVNDSHAGPRTVSIDYERMLRVLANVIGDMIRFSDRDSTITLHAEYDRANVKFSISTTGYVLSESERADLFERLAIARDIVDSHDGTLGINEESREETSLYFILPAI